MHGSVQQGCTGSDTSPRLAILRGDPEPEVAGPWRGAGSVIGCKVARHPVIFGAGSARQRIGGGPTRQQTAAPDCIEPVPPGVRRTSVVNETATRQRSSAPPGSRFGKILILPASRPVRLGRSVLDWPGAALTSIQV